MRLRDMGIVAVRRFGAEGGLLVLLGIEQARDGHGCALGVTPLAVAPRQEGPHASMPRVGTCDSPPLRGALCCFPPPWRPLTAKPFRLDVRQGVRGARARFSRVLELPPVLLGLGLGSFLLCSLVRRAVAFGWGGAQVRSLHLLKRQNAPLRNAFYERMGFDLVLYSDGSGWARAKRLDQLRVAHDASKVRAMPGPGASPFASSPAGVGMVNALKSID